MTAQDNWRWCRKCQGLHWGGQSAGICASGGGHDFAGSGNYTLWWGGSTYQTSFTPNLHVLSLLLVFHLHYLSLFLNSLNFFFIFDFCSSLNAQRFF
jgi:hypothetical protein